MVLSRINDSRGQAQGSPYWAGPAQLIFIYEIDHEIPR